MLEPNFEEADGLGISKCWLIQFRKLYKPNQKQYLIYSKKKCIHKILKGDAITADPTAIQFFIYHSNLPPNYAQLLKEQNKTKDDECQEYRLVCRQ